MGVLIGEFICNSVAESRGYFYNGVLDIFKSLLIIVLEIIQYRLGSTSSPRTCLHNPYLVPCLVLGFVYLVHSTNVFCDSHPVVWLEYLTWSQPCVLWVLLYELTLVVIKSNQLLKVYWRLQLTYLVVYLLYSLYLSYKNNPTLGGIDGRK